MPPDQKPGNENIAKQPETTPVKKKKSFLRRLPKYILFFFSFIVLLLIILYFFIQTDTFNKWAIEYTIKQVNDSWKLKQSKLDYATTEGNILKGIKLTYGSLTLQGDTLFKFKDFEVHYNIWGLLKKEIEVSQVTLNEPVINLYKIKGEGDSVLWNFKYLFSTKAEEDTTAKPFDWGVIVDNLQIHNGHIRIIERLDTGVTANKFKFEHLTGFETQKLDITNFELDLSARYFLDDKELHLKNFSFNTNSDFNLRKFSMDTWVHIRDTTTHISNFEFKTDRTELYIKELFMNHFNPFVAVNYENFKDNVVWIDMSLNKFNFKDLTFFIPEVNFLDSTVSVELKANGKYSSLNIEKLVLKTPDSYYSFKGRVDNLQKPENLFFDITGQDLVMDAKDTRNILPGLGIPDYSHIGKVSGNLKYLGTPTNFTADFNLSSQAGNFMGHGQLDLDTPQPYYDADVTVFNLNLGKILKSSQLEGRVNARVKANGSGFDPRYMSSRIVYDMGGSTIFKQSISRSAGIFNIHNNNVDANLTLASPQLETSVKANVNLSNIDNASYVLKGNARNLDISGFTHNAANKSNLTFSFDINGKGLSLNNINGTYNMNFAESYYSDFHIPATPVNIKISNSLANGSISASTDMFDFNAAGHFNLGQIANVVNANIDYVKSEFDRKLQADSGLFVSALSPHINTSPFDFKYEFITKDAKKLASVLKKEDVAFDGHVKGSLSNSAEGFNLTTDIFAVKNMLYRDSSILLDNVNANILFQNDYTKISPDLDAALYPITADINIRGDKIVFNGTRYDSIVTKIVMKDAMNSFSIAGKKDTSIIVNVKGSSMLGTHLIGINLESMFVKYNKFSVKNDGELIVKYNPQKGQKTFTFEQFNVTKDNMKLNAKGDFSLDGQSKLNVEATGIKIAEVMELLYPPDSLVRKRNPNTEYKSPVKGNIRRLSIVYNGTFEDPSIKLEMNTDLLRYEETKIGRIDAFVDYNSSVLTNDILVSSSQGSGRLRLTGNVPIANPFSSSNEDTASVVSLLSDLPVNFTLHSKDFQINFFSKLIPNFAELRGLLNGQISATGTVSSPQFNGEMNIDKGRFLLSLTGIYYRFNTKLIADGSNLNISQFRIMNETKNDPHIDVTGKVNFEGLKVNDIDFSARGGLVLLDNSAQDNDLDIYGEVIASIGNPEVALKGNLEKMYLTGQFLISSADISSRSAIASSVYDIYDDNFVYKIIPDSTRDRTQDTIIVISPEEYENIDPFMRSRYAVYAQSKSVETNLIYDINIKTENNLIVNINFNEIPKQQLFGEITADINMNNKVGNAMQMFGTINVVGDSYFRFYRNFKVRNTKIIFTGPPGNPELSVHAVYENKSTTSQPVQVIMDITGDANKPNFSLKLYEGGQESTGKDAQSDAISYLIFGVPSSQLSQNQRNNLASIGATTGSSYLSGVLSEAVRDIAPFVTSAEVNYTENQGADLFITSQFGDAIVKVGGRIFNDLSNTEVSIQYPLNKLFNIKLTNELTLEVFRTTDFNIVTGDNRTITTGAKILYVIHY